MIGSCFYIQFSLVARTISKYDFIFYQNMLLLEDKQEHFKYPSSTKYWDFLDQIAISNISSFSLFSLILFGEKREQFTFVFAIQVVNSVCSG